MCWIGGGSGAGKSTVAQELVVRRGAVLYDTDAAMDEHVSRCHMARCPKLRAFMNMDMDARWVHRTPQVMLDSFHWFEGEGFELIVDDLLALPRDRPVIAEGFRLLPKRVVPLLQAPRRAIWLLPTPTFRRRAFDARGTTWDIAHKTNDPEKALANLLARDALFTARLRAEIAELGLQAIRVDGSLSPDQLCKDVDDRLFG
ncbi:AAA family ATPase [uncultured Tateyamaria sp.]|uniref:AAA family ATPase n=1 Tax=uncultured Tateyamaria sp. TaxID=455651 RepID=UPI002607DF89|nr:AAA family ATPase [uncultured Tateyamaria sp.]